MGQDLGKCSAVNLDPRLISDILGAVDPGHHTDTQPIDDDLSLNLSRANLEAIPLGLCQSFPFAKIIDLSENSIGIVSHADLELFECLKTLILRSNSIRFIWEDVFGEESSISAHLRVLDLSRNKLTSLPASIGNLMSLEDLDLESNSLVELPHEIGWLANLDHLNVRSNKLVNLPAGLAFLPKLTRLNIGLNQIQKFPDEYSAANAFPKIQFFYMNSNRLVDIGIHPMVLSRFSCVDLRNNALLKHWPEFRTKSHRLSSIDVSQCPVGSVDFKPNLEHLLTLDLSNCELKQLPTTIKYLLRLRILRVPNNNLEKLPEEVASLTKLTHLEADCNRLTRLPENLGANQLLSTLSLSENQLHCLPERISCSQLGLLNVSNNKLTHIPAYILYAPADGFKRVIKASNNPIINPNSPASTDSPDSSPSPTLGPKSLSLKNVELILHKV
jgi:leucine-rich repeat protein SHOC2